MWEKELWIARRKSIETNDMGVEIEKFYTPIRYRLNYQPVTDQVSMMEYGEHIIDVYRAFVMRNKYQSILKVGDRIYLCDGEIGEDELKDLVESDDEFCNKANYVVKCVLPQNFLTRVDFIKRR